MAAAAPLPLRAQWAAMLDAGPAYVEYEGFLGSSVVTLAPSTRWAVPNASVAARGALTRFESGHTSFGGDVAGAWYATPPGPVSLGFTVDGSLSRYQLAPSALRGRFGIRAEANTGAVTWWSAATLGALHQGDGSSTLTEGDLGAAAPFPGGTLFGTAALHWVDGTPYSDGEIGARIGREPFLITGTAGARATHTLGGRQQWAHADIACQIAPHVSMTVGGGSYPSDPTVNTPGARYIAVGLHLAWGGAERARPGTIRLPAPPRPPIFATGSTPATDVAGRETPNARTPPPSPSNNLPTAIIDREAGHAVVFHVHAPGAHLVELSGDFTAWQPVALDPTVDGGWMIRLTLSPGAHRLDIRVDNGPWVAPAGVPQVADDFGGTVGVFASP